MRHVTVPRWLVWVFVAALVVLAASFVASVWGMNFASH